MTSVLFYWFYFNLNLIKTAIEIRKEKRNNLKKNIQTKCAVGSLLTVIMESGGVQEANEPTTESWA